MMRRSLPIRLTARFFLVDFRISYATFYEYGDSTIGNLIPSLHSSLKYPRSIRIACVLSSSSVEYRDCVYGLIILKNRASPSRARTTK